MHLGVNLSKRKSKVKVGPELNLSTINEIDAVQLTRHIIVSQVYAIFNLLGLLAPVTIGLKLLLQ